MASFTNKAERCGISWLLSHPPCSFLSPLPSLSLRDCRVPPPRVLGSSGKCFFCLCSFSAPHPATSLRAREEVPGLRSPGFTEDPPVLHLSLDGPPELLDPFFPPGSFFLHCSCWPASLPLPPSALNSPWLLSAIQKVRSPWILAL